MPPVIRADKPNGATREGQPTVFSRVQVCGDAAIGRLAQHYHAWRCNAAHDHATDRWGVVTDHGRLLNPAHNDNRVRRGSEYGG
ncbi:hypothetical protein D3C72_1860700 [compost metagenome]